MLTGKFRVAPHVAGIARKARRHLLPIRR
jgi:hypothetical protein